MNLRNFLYRFIGDVAVVVSIVAVAGAVMHDHTPYTAPPVVYWNLA